MEADPVIELGNRLRLEGRFWGDCRCGLPLHRHGRRKLPNSGIDQYDCWRTKSGRFEPRTLPELDYTPARGLHCPA